MPTKIICAVLICLMLASPAFSQKRGSIPTATLLLITKAEDERRWNNDLRDLFSSRNALVRQRAALAAGRIGDEQSVAALTDLLDKDRDPSVRAMAAFALGEVESETGANALVAVIKNSRNPVEIRARAVEALGKIAGALPREQEARQRELGATVLDALKSSSEQPVILLGLTAVLRSRPANAGPVLAGFLNHPNARVRADAANALARLRLKEGNEQLKKLLATDPDPIVRANAARVLGATDDRLSLAPLLDLVNKDKDSRVRVSAIRALGGLKNPDAAEPLLAYARKLPQPSRTSRPAELNEILELATVIGRLMSFQRNQAAYDWLHSVNEVLNHTAPEIDTAMVQISPGAYLSEFGSGDEARLNVQRTILLNWRAAASIAGALRELANLPEVIADKGQFRIKAYSLLVAMLDYRNSGLNINTLVAVHSEYAIPAVLRALAAFNPTDLPALLRAQLQESDVVVRATAADLLGERPPTEENARALAAAWPQAARDSLNDAALSIIDSLGKQKSETANEILKEALKSSDQIVRRRAVAALKANGAGDFSEQIGTVRSRNTETDYRRALARIGKPVRAVVTTSIGSFTIELLPQEAPLTVDNFVQLAQRNYFRNIVIHRVVPNFVIQDGDPRGDGNGGPGYQIRCEINQVPYDRAAVGMALSGKDTGGSQWFVTHSPQPHLDGGYTVFGKVIAGMDVVDRIARGDVIQSIRIQQGGRSKR